jgi:HAD superfamily hydrolase (TIGR01509 family)
MTPPTVMTRAVIFDCDGVVVDSEGPTFAMLGEDLARHGLPRSVPQMEAMFLGGTVQGVFDTARSLGATLPDDWVADFYERLYARLGQGTPLVAGILGVLDRLDAQNIPYAIGSNGSARKMEVTLGQHPGLIARFQGRIFSAYNVARPKPAPDLYLHAARALGVPPQDCVVIEDSPNGARAARAAGMRCMGYAPHGDGAGLLAEGAQIFRAMQDLRFG